MITYSVIVCLLAVVGIGLSLVTDQKIAVPAYFIDAQFWKQIEQSNEVGIAVVNPNSGPDTSRDPNFAQLIRESVNAGRKVIGYVDTGYFGRADNRKTRQGESCACAWTQQVKEDIDAYYNFYGDSGLSGIFLDDGLNNCGEGNANVTLYQVVHDYIKTNHPEAFVVVNPGTGVEQCYASVADVLIVFESGYEAYLNWVQPEWSQQQENGKQFWHLIYAAKTEAEMENAMKLTKERNAGYVYVTDDDLPNPWDTLPNYWDQERSKTQG